MLRIVRSARHRFMRGLAGGSAAGRGKLRNYLIRCYEFEVIPNSMAWSTGTGHPPLPIKRRYSSQYLYACLPTIFRIARPGCSVGWYLSNGLCPLQGAVPMDSFLSNVLTTYQCKKELCSYVTRLHHWKGLSNFGFESSSLVHDYLKGSNLPTLDGWV